MNTESSQTPSRSSSFDRVIFIDWGLFLHRSIFAFASSGGQIPPTYTCLRMVVSNLKLVNYTSNDLVIVAIDGRGNWRRDVDPAYKANRKDLREKSEIDWYHWYRKFDEMVEKLKASTPFHYIRIDKLEADDIIAVGVKHFNTVPCIIISSDSDFEQLYAYDNVKIFSPVSKKYKEVANPYKVLANKVKQEKTDNLVSPILNEADFKRRMSVVSLLSLPDFVTNNTLDKFKDVEYNKPYDLNWIPFRSLYSVFESLFNNTNKNEFIVDVKTKKVKKPRNTKNRKEQTKNVIQSNEKIF